MHHKLIQHHDIGADHLQGRQTLEKRGPDVRAGHVGGMHTWTYYHRETQVGRSRCAVSLADLPHKVSESSYTHRGDLALHRCR